MVFAAVPGELPGLSYGRGLLIFTMTLVFRAVIVPSSALRTLALGLLAACFPVAAAHLWYSSNPASIAASACRGICSDHAFEVSVRSEYATGFRLRRGLSLWPRGRS